MNKNVSAEHSSLRPANHYNNEYSYQYNPTVLKLRTGPHPRAMTIDGTPLHHFDSNTNNHEFKTLNSKSPKTRSSYDYRDPLHTPHCTPMQPWQTTSFPSCSSIHELDFYSKSRTAEFKFLTSGGYNDIFSLQDELLGVNPPLAIKILQEGTKYTDRNYDRVRRDGLILERSTSSRYVTDIYGFCGFLVLVPYADGGNLSRALRKKKEVKLPPLQKLRYAREVSAGLAAVHDIDGEKLSAVTQGDLKADQYLWMDGVWKLGDFNRGRFLRRNVTDPHSACPYTIGVNDAAYRSPEEYKYLPETSAIDVWAMGSLIYHILHRYEVWNNLNTEKAQQKIMDGELPEIEDKYKRSEDPAIKALLEAIDMCYVYDPEKRAKAWDVSSFLEKKLREIENDIMEEEEWSLYY